VVGLALSLSETMAGYIKRWASVVPDKKDRELAYPLVQYF